MRDRDRGGDQIMLSIVVLSLAAAQPASTTSADAISTDIDMSEWGSFKSLHLNLRNGAYTVTAVPSVDPLTRRPAAAPRGGILSQEQRARLSPLIRPALAEGLTDPICDRTPRLNHAVVSNGGTPAMQITVGGRVFRSALSFQCWRPAARKLDTALNDAFADVVRAMDHEISKPVRENRAGSIQ